MKQKKLVKKLYEACFIKDSEQIDKLRKEEFKKILKHKEAGKSFNTNWTIVKI